VIHLTRLNGQGFVLNPDLVLKAESTPDTVVTLVDGTKFVVIEPLDVLSDRVVQYRAQVVATARELPGCQVPDAAERHGAEPHARHGAELFAVEVPALADRERAAGLDTVLAEPVPLRRRRRP
jgi:flagellar protein FlbD